MNKYTEILAGLILLLAPIYAWITNLAGLGQAATILLKGGIIWALLGAGLIFLLLGLSDLKN